MIKVVYLVYEDLGYDGIDIEGIATDEQTAMKIAEEADKDKKRDIIIEKWPVNQKGRGEFEGATLWIVKGAVKLRKM